MRPGRVLWLVVWATALAGGAGYGVALVLCSRLLGMEWFGPVYLGIAFCVFMALTGPPARPPHGRVDPRSETR